MASNSTAPNQNPQSVIDATQEKVKAVAKGTTKKRGRPPKKTKTTRESIYKEQTTVLLPDSNVEVVYNPPGVPQKATFLEFMTISVLPLVMTEPEIKRLKKEDLYTTVFREFDTMLNGAEPERQAGIIAMILMNHQGKQLMYELIMECFPGLNPSQLTDQAYIECFGILIDDFNKSVFGVKT